MKCSTFSPAVERSLKRVKTKLAAYMETGDTNFLSEYRSHSTELSAKCAELLLKVNDNPAQTERSHKLFTTAQKGDWCL